MKTHTRFLLPACLLAVALPALAADWPQWRGPNRDDISTETGLLKEWPKGGPKLLWTFEDAGIGYSSPSIVGNTLYMLGGDEKQEYVYALDLATQKKLWSTDVGKFFPHGNGSGPRGTPTVVGDVLYCLTGPGELLCVGTKDGQIRWQKNLKSKDIEGQMASGWGYSESPLVDGDKVVVTPGGKKGAIAAFDRKTGDLLWRSKDLTSPATYSSIIVATIGGVKQYVQVTGGGVAGVSAEDGAMLWKSNQSAHGISVSTPVAKDDYVYVSTGYGVGGGAVEITKSGDKFEAKKVYETDEQKLMMNHHGGFILIGDYVYGHSDSKGWICQGLKTGKLMSQAKAPPKMRALGKGSVTCADGRLYCYTEQGGHCALFDASPKEWKEMGRLTIPKRSKKNVNMTWTHPVVCNGRLYLRDQEYLFCYDVSGK